MGELVSIVYKPQDAQPFPDGYTRVPLQEAQLIAGYGIERDTKGGHPSRQVNIMSLETMQTLAPEGFQTAPGQLGEQLIVSGVNVDSLPMGTRLQIGARACIELVEPRTGCVKFEGHQGKQREEAANRLGFMGRVLVSGTISIGDSVQLMDKEE